MNKQKSELSQLKNLGPKSEAWLNNVGIYTREDLDALGAIQTYQLLRTQGYKVTLTMVYAIQGALMDLHWTDLPLALKASLKDAVKKLE
ncbi:MAG: TfoX/Sxy family protein [Chloroflexota bacterium]